MTYLSSITALKSNLPFLKSRLISFHLEEEDFDITVLPQNDEF